MSAIKWWRQDQFVWGEWGDVLIRVCPLSPTHNPGPKGRVLWSYSFSAPGYYGVVGPQFDNWEEARAAAHQFASIYKEKRERVAP